MVPTTRLLLLEKRDQEQANHWNENTTPVVPAAASTETNSVAPDAASKENPVVPVAASTENPVVPAAASTNTTSLSFLYAYCMYEFET